MRGRRLLGGRPRRAARARRRRGVPRSAPARPPRATSSASGSSRPRGSAGAEAIHPGYGFLAENAAFARAVEEAGLVVDRAAARGDRADGLEDAGADGDAARRACRSSRARPSPSRRVAEVLRLGEEVGYPLIVKAAAGGGGKGMKLVAAPGRGGARVRVGAARGREVLRRRPRLRRALPRGSAPRRGAGARGRARQRDPPRRARLHDPAPPPEARRGDALARGRRRRCASGSAGSRSTRRAPPATARPGRSRASSPRTATTTSWR